MISYFILFTDTSLFSKLFSCFFFVKKMHVQSSSNFIRKFADSPIHKFDIIPRNIFNTLSTDIQRMKRNARSKCYSLMCSKYQPLPISQNWPLTRFEQFNCIRNTQD